MTKKAKINGQKAAFDASSPGFLYTVIVTALTLLALAGVQFPDNPADTAADLTNLLSTSGFWALIGVAASSILFPIYNAWKKGSLTFKGVFSNVLTYVALGVLFFDGLALLGLNFPTGTAEQLVYAVFAKDWTSLISLLFTVILPTVVRFIKSKQGVQE
jgi:hypothetical protein